MKNFNIKIDPNPISKEEIFETKPSFSSVTKNFNGFKTPFFKSGWFIGGASGLSVVAIVASLMYFSNAKQNNVEIKSNIGDSIHKTEKFICNPISNIDIPFETFTFDNNKKTECKTKNGSKIIVPANSFAHDDGSTIDGLVTLKFREMHNPYDFFISGIPMQYDTAGVSHTFESAGMFEIRAIDNAGELNLIPGKKIHIDLVTNDNNPKYNFYYLDTNKRNWVYVEKSDCEKMSKSVKPINDADYTTSYEPNKNAQFNEENFKFFLPQKSKVVKNTFKVEFEPKEFPELSIYKNVLFEVNTSKSKFDTKLFDVKWSQIKLKSSKTKGNYLMVLSRKDSSVFLYVVPVFADKDYSKAVVAYEQQKELLKKSIEKENELSEEALKSRANIVASNEIIGNKIIGTRSADISFLGFYNHDCPMPVQDYIFEPEFSMNGQKINPASIHAVDRTVNAIFNYDNKIKQIRCNRKSDVIMWIVCGDNKIGIIDNSDFMSATKSTTKPNFKVKLLDTHEGLAQLKKMVEI